MEIPCGLEPLLSSRRDRCSTWMINSRKDRYIDHSAGKGEDVSERHLDNTDEFRERMERLKSCSERRERGAQSWAKRRLGGL
jgi:hypothetical protein